MKYFNNHLSIKTIQEKFRNSFNVKFEFVSTDIVLRYINEIDIKKVQAEKYLLPLLN